jgi:ribosomal protein L11 methylase PrmA
MLEDHKRTGAYYNAVLQNRRQFQGKVVLDVGTGSGILAIFAAMAGAKKVYAVEATDMAKSARKLVEANKVACFALFCFVLFVWLCLFVWGVCLFSRTRTGCKSPSC